GADEAEAYYERELGLDIKAFGGHVERFSYSESAGLGIRVFDGGRPGRAYTSDLSAEAIEEAVRSAVESTGVSPEDPDRFLPGPELFPPGALDGALLGEDLCIWAEDLAEVNTEEKLEFALGLERYAKGHDPRVKGVESAVYSESTSQTALASTKGLRAGYRSSVCYGYLMAIAEERGESQTGFGFTAGRSFGSLDVRSAAEEAASMAVALLGARQVETARVPVLIDNLSTAELIAVLGMSLSAESVVKGKSFLADKLGHQIASERLELMDDGQMEGGFGTAPFDAEGVATSKKALIKKGVLKTFLHNCYTASRTGVQSTGNAGRSSFRASVGVVPTNIYMKPGKETPEELRSGMGRGFEVLELQGVHVGLNPVTGEVSVGAKGRWVEDGRPVHPVREVTIAGTTEDILKGIVGIGSDIRFTPLLGGIGTPSILVEGLVVGGK
ncbi:MAG: TldD/PmbA family protein, partial [Actinobacteria bacterium]|nr:TldD/PmbA family protein [Actinomycetota bacterium]